MILLNSSTVVIHCLKPAADGIRFLKEAGADESVLTLKSLEALKDMAEGKATKIIVPSDLQGLAGLATSLKEIMTDKNIEKK